MLPTYRVEKFMLTPKRAQKILAEHGTEITLEDAVIMLELLRKLCKLSVSEIFNNISASDNQVPTEGKV